MKTFFKAFIIMPLLALTLTACAPTHKTHGHVLKPEQIERIKVGIHSKRDVLQTLGSPSTLATFNDNRWYYLTEKTISKPLHPNQLTDRTIYIVDFDELGIVADVHTKTKEDGKELTPTEDKTPTHGQSLGIIDQTLQNIGKGL